MKIDAQALMNTTQQAGREPPAGQRQAQWQQAVERAYAHRLAQQSSMAAPARQVAGPNTLPPSVARLAAAGASAEVSRGGEAALGGVRWAPPGGSVSVAGLVVKSPRAAEPGGVRMAPREPRPLQGDARGEAEGWSAGAPQPRQTDHAGPLESVATPGEDDVAIDARWGDDGVMVGIYVPRVRLAERDSIIAAVMQHFALHGVRVSRVTCNQEVVFENTRGADALVRADI